MEKHRIHERSRKVLEQFLLFMAYIVNPDLFVGHCRT